MDTCFSLPQHHLGFEMLSLLLEVIDERKNKPVERWEMDELTVVQQAGIELASKQQWQPPTDEDVARAESMASGHVDYAKTWVLELIGIMCQNADTGMNTSGLAEPKLQTNRNN